ncbi:hypothetical protein [Veillonella sp.]|uniref:hypothetical protein n=1 Tax=Veillonella sp. TaxID=1926307 RepID=UPI0025DF194A|nr:hypothetical protein [Veillonella sp.]
MVKLAIKTGLYTVGGLALFSSAGVVDYPQADFVDFVACISTGAACILAAEKIKVNWNDEDVIIPEPENVILEIPQRHAYNWAKQGRPGEIRL